MLIPIETTLLLQLTSALLSIYYGITIVFIMTLYAVRRHEGAAEASRPHITESGCENSGRILQSRLASIVIRQSSCMVTDNDADVTKVIRHPIYRKISEIDAAQTLILTCLCALLTVRLILIEQPHRSFSCSITVPVVVWYRCVGQFANAALARVAPDKGRLICWLSCQSYENGMACTGYWFGRLPLPQYQGF